MATVAEKLLTIEEYDELPDPGYPTELVRGRVVEMGSPKPRHGKICIRVGSLLARYLEGDDRGQVFGNDTGVITERDPDTLRGADVSYYSYQRVPRGTSLDDYFDVAPELIFEVLSPSDRWPKVLGKVAEYLEAGVLLVCILDPEKQQARFYRSDRRDGVLGPDDEWSAPEILGEFRVPVRRFFE